MIRRISLQTRLFVLLVLLLAILWTTLLVDAQRSAQHVAAREVETRLHGTADFLLTISRRHELDAAGIADVLDAANRRFTTDSLGAPVYELIRGGDVIARSEGFPALRSRPEPGLTTATGNEGRWTVLTVVDVGEDTTGRAALRREAQDGRAADLRSSRMVSLNILLPLFGIGVLTSVWVGLRPLRLIRQRITNIDPKEPAQLGLRADRVPKEIADLAEAFDALVSRLARVMTGQRIFASVASHELRTPLAGAMSQIDVLKRDPDSPGALERLTESLRYMDRLVSQLLALAREEASVSAKGPSTFDVVALVRDLQKELERDGPDLRIALAAPDAPVTITGYPDLVRSLLRNLVQNALAASENRPVSLTVEATRDMVGLVVADLGPGFPPEYRRASFDPFVRGITAIHSGSGLGLTVAQWILELHQGTIEIADRPGGAQVTARLPRTLRTLRTR